MPAVTSSAWPQGISKHVDWPRHSLAQNLIDTATRVPKRDALVFYGRTLSYSALHDAVDHMAGYLQFECGVSKGDRVLLFMQNSPQFVIAYYAILRADAVVIPVNAMNRQAELVHLASDTGARVAFCGTELLGFMNPLVESGALDRVIAANYADMADPDYDLALPTPLSDLREDDYVGSNITLWSTAMAAKATPNAITARGDDIAVIPYSSGTVGQPKGCVHTHFSTNVTAVGGAHWNPIPEGTVTLATLPFFHVTGMQSVMNGAIYAGSTMVIMTRWDRKVAAELIKRYRVNRWRSIATMAIDLVNDPDFESYDLSSLDAIGGGGAAMPEAIAAQLKAMTGLDYVEGYGLSETMAATHINPITAPKRQCLGIAVFDVDARVISLVDDTELGPDEPGEIVMNAPQVFQGYWNNPEATKAAFIEIDGKPFFRSGDIGYYDSEGYFFMVDRVKRMINASGFKVWPAEVETLMHAHPDIREACVIGVPDARRGEAVKAYVVAAENAGGTLNEADIIAWCRKEMAAYKCPSTVAIVEALPKSGAGKVLWRSLMETDANADAKP